ncbi:hypothetical protein [Flavivirga jejuensis]|uniref:Uncharacterized protein n=1 Tax=Flavivirga jejuensis TaxID=870487 RepID=A0ABT8WK65_9FLAO|nr:hypothetical protein [Flavivirga jejuensis]MDO5973535.1 hypothetical protein [Flavivirga jejuensis]
MEKTCENIKNTNPSVRFENEEIAIDRSPGSFLLKGESFGDLKNSLIGSTSEGIKILVLLFINSDIISFV